MAYPPAKAKGHGTVVEQTRGCREFESFAQYFRLGEDGAYGASNAVLYGPGCENVAVGTRTGPLLAKKSYQFRDGSSGELILVQLADGRKVWLDEGEVEFP